MTNERLRATGCSAAVFFGLLYWLNPGALNYLLRTPSELSALTPAHVLNSILAPLALAAGLLLGFRHLGAPLLTLLLGRGERPRWEPILATALGAATVALALFLAGSLGLFRPELLRAAGGVLIVLGLTGRFRGRTVRAANWPRELWASAAAGLLAYLAWNAVVRALAPPTDVDVLKYHLPLPESYLRSHFVAAIPWQVFSHWPQSTEMLYGLALAFHSDAAAALLHAGVCGLLVLLTYRLARDEYGLDEAGALAAACLVAAQPVLIREAGAAMSDGTLALFYALSCACLRRWRLLRDPAWLKLAGLTAGAAAAVKFHGAILLVGLAGWLAATELRASAREGRRAVTVFLGWSLIFAAPWYLKEWAASGNPVWPFLPGLFGGNWGAASVAALISPSAPSFNFHWIFIGEGALFLLLPAAASLLWAARRRERLDFAADLAPALLYLPLAATAISLWRYMLPFYPALALIAGWGFSKALKSGRAARALAALLLAFGLSGALRATNNNELFPVLGLRSRLHPELSPREAYLSQALSGHDFTRAANAVLTPRDRVLLFAENRGYYFTADYLYGDPSEQGVLDYASAAGPDELRDLLARAGITHLAVNQDGDWYADAVRRSSPRAFALVLETARRHGTPVLTAQGRTLYAFPPMSKNSQNR